MEVINSSFIRFVYENKIVNEKINILPNGIYAILQNFTQLDELGLNEASSPSKYMSYFIPIMPNKLRNKTIMNSESVISGAYKAIITFVNENLKKIYNLINSEENYYNIPVFLENDFARYYDKLMSYYLLITNTNAVNAVSLLKTIDKRDQKRLTDKPIDLLNKLKGKRSLFNQGIVASRHNISGRTVLGGLIDSDMSFLGVPSSVTKALTMSYPVYQENIYLMKRIVNEMKKAKNTIIKATSICERSGKIFKITNKNAFDLATNLKAGDKVNISLMNNDFILQIRFPSIREECWTAFKIRRTNAPIIQIPLPPSKIKSADFDGDEVNILTLPSHQYDAEALLLSSSYAQFLNYGKGNTSFVWMDEGESGLNKFKIDTKIHYFNGIAHKELSFITNNIEQYLPSHELLPFESHEKGLSYKDDKIHIKNGKIINIKNFSNNEFLKYIYVVYGSEFLIKFHHNILQLAYDANENWGNTLGNEIKIYGTETKNIIKRTQNETLIELTKLEMENNPYKIYSIIEKAEKQKVALQKVLKTSAAGTNLEILKYTEKRLSEYYDMAVSQKYSLLDNNRLDPTLGEGTRVYYSYHRFTVNPKAYGYNDRPYIIGLRPISHFNDCRVERKGIFIRGENTAIQGYFSKRIAMKHGMCVTDYMGRVIANNYIISNTYGEMNVSPRYYFKTKLIDLSLEKEEFSKKYIKDKRLIELHEEINKNNNRFLNLTAFNTVITTDEIGLGFNFDQYCFDVYGIEF
jgi:hypothetical protein